MTDDGRRSPRGRGGRSTGRPGPQGEDRAGRGGARRRGPGSGRSRPPARSATAGDLPVVELEVGAPAHGGHCVARHEGRVVFVRHALPGERVRVQLTDAADGASFWRGDAIEVLEASADRVPSAWPAAGPGGVGGGELAHVALPAQRRWKQAVVEEQLRRLARLDLSVPVEAAPGDDDRGGLGYRTRLELVADEAGRAGMHRYRSHDVVPLESMPLAVPGAEDLGLWERRWPAGARITAVVPAGGDRPLVLVDGEPWGARGPDRRPSARSSVRERAVVDGRELEWRVSAAGFWQVHREAPALLAQVVVDAVTGSGDVTGDRVVDLYAGAGLLTLPLAHAVGPDGHVLAVEGDARAVTDARRNLHAQPWVELRHGPVAEVLGRLTDPADAAGAQGPARADVVVLDPPRVGAGREVLAAVAALAPRRVVHVACDPAALARDVADLRGHGYQVTSLRAFDLFPMTHHVECVAVLDRE